MLMAPLVRRTWSPRGQTPILYQKTRSHKKVSVIAALCIAPCQNCLSLYFRLHPNININTDTVVAFLRCILKELIGHIIIVWDRFQPHRSKKVQQLLVANPRLHLDFFPPLANMTAMELDALTTNTRGNMRSLQKKQPLLCSFFKKCGLSLRIK